MSVVNPLITESGFGPLTVNRFGEAYLFALNRHAFEQLSAEAQFQAQFAERLRQEDTLHIVVGTDSGLLPRFVEQHCLVKGSRYVFIEPESVLDSLQQQGLLDSLNERIQVISMAAWTDTVSQFKINDYLYIDGVRSHNALCAQDDAIHEYAELSWHITELLAQMHWQANAELGSEAFINRQIENIADNRWPAKWLDNAFAGHTALLLAGGPSLDLALDWAKQNRQRLVILAVSRIARQLLAADLQPDFVFSVDPTELSFDISKEMLRFGEQTTLITSYHIVPGLLNQWPGRVFYLGERLPWKSDLNVANFGSAGPTVTNTALHTAHHMGFKRVILAGVDLCFTRQGVTHASGSNEQLAGPRFNLTSLQVETNDGGLAPTSCDFAHAIKSLHAQAIILGRADCRIVNCAPSAARVDGIDFVPLSDLELNAHDLDVLGVVEARAAQAVPAAVYLDKVAQELKRALYQTRTIKQLAQQARKLNDDMYGVGETVIDFKGKQALDKIEKKFRREYRQFSRLIKKIGIRRLIQLAKPFTDEEWSAEEVQKLGAAYYDAYIDGAAQLEKLLLQAERVVQARQQEHADKPDWPLLFEVAEQQRSFGRVRLWRQMIAADDGLLEAMRLGLDQLQAKFEAVLADTDTVHFRQAKRHNALNNVKQRAALLFKHQKRDELTDLLAALDQHHDQQAVTCYRHLVCGYVAELDGLVQAALEHYQALIDQGESLLEDALLRVTVLSISAQDEGGAGLALQCLAQINPLYLPFHAQMLRLRGEALSAIDAYNLYIERFPQDILAQVKLAQLYLDLGLGDAARMMVDFIRQQHPQHPGLVALQNQLDEQMLAV